MNSKSGFIIMLLLFFTSPCLAQTFQSPSPLSMPVADLAIFQALNRQLQNDDRAIRLASLSEASLSRFRHESSKILFLEKLVINAQIHQEIRFFSLHRLLGILVTRSDPGGYAPRLPNVVEIFELLLHERNELLRQFALTKLSFFANQAPDQFRPLVLAGLRSDLPSVRFGMMSSAFQIPAYHQDQEIPTLLRGLAHDRQIQEIALSHARQGLMAALSEDEVRTTLIERLSQLLRIGTWESEIVYNSIQSSPSVAVPNFRRIIRRLERDANSDRDHRYPFSSPPVLRRGAIYQHSPLRAAPALENLTLLDSEQDDLLPSQESANLLQDHPKGEVHKNFSSLTARALVKVWEDYYREHPYDGKVPLQDHLLLKLQKYSPLGIALQNPITMEAFAGFKEFHETLVNLNLLKKGQTRHLLERIYFVLKHLEVYAGLTPGPLEQLEIDPDALKVALPTLPYDELLTKLNDPKFNNFKKLFFILAHDETFLKGTSYLDPIDRNSESDCLTKAGDVAHFFNELTGEEDFINGIRRFSGFGTHGGTFMEAPANFRSELLYKMMVIAKKTQENSGHIDPEEKRFLTQALMHGGRHCQDAKAHVINDLLFPSLCPQEALALEEMSDTKGDPYVEAYVAAGKLKTHSLESLLQSRIPVNANESTSIKNATWDKLAPLVGVALVNSPYPSMALQEVNVQDFLRIYNPKKLIEFYKKASVPRYQEELGPLVNFVGPEYYDFMAKAELIRFGLLRAK